MAPGYLLGPMTMFQHKMFQQVQMDGTAMKQVTPFLQQIKYKGGKTWAPYTKKDVADTY